MQDQASPRVQLLDFDALSGAADAPRGLAGTWTDWHYSCKFLWDQPQVHDANLDLALSLTVAQGHQLTDRKGRTP